MVIANPTWTEDSHNVLQSFRALSFLLLCDDMFLLIGMQHELPQWESRRVGGDSPPLRGCSSARP